MEGLNRPHDARFAGIYDRHRSAVWLYCRRRVGADRADDVMGEVFLTGGVVSTKPRANRKHSRGYTESAN